MEQFFLNSYLIKQAIRKKDDQFPFTLLTKINGRPTRAIEQTIYSLKSIYKLFFLAFAIKFLFMLARKFNNKDSKKQKLEKLKKQLKRFVSDYIRSLLFIAGYCFLGVQAFLLSTLYLKPTLRNGLIAVFLSGPLLRIENLERQKEISLYIFKNGLQAVFNLLQRRKLFQRQKMIYLINGVSLALICYLYFTERETIQQKYKNILDFLIRQEN